MKKINILFAALLAVMAVVFVSRANCIEISALDTVSGIAIDYDGGNWKVVCEICSPSSDSDYGSTCTYVTGEGKTLVQAFGQAEKSCPNILYTDCVQLYVIGKNASGMDELNDYFMGDKINLRAVTVYADSSASDTLYDEKDSENSRAKSLNISKKVKRFTAKLGLPRPGVIQYLKGKTAVVISKNSIPERVESNDI